MASYEQRTTLKLTGNALSVFSQYSNSTSGAPNGKSRFIVCNSFS